MFFVWHDLLKAGGLGLAVVLPSQYLPPTPKVVARVLSDFSIAVWVGVVEVEYILQKNRAETCGFGLALL